MTPELEQEPKIFLDSSQEMIDHPESLYTQESIKAFMYRASRPETLMDELYQQYLNSLSTEEDR